MEGSSHGEEMPSLESIYEDVHVPSDQTQAGDGEALGPSRPVTTELLLDPNRTEPTTTYKAKTWRELECVIFVYPISAPSQEGKPSPNASERSIGLAHQQPRLRRYKKTAQELAADALVTDNGGRLTFDPNRGQGADLMKEVEAFLAKYPPSRVREVNGSPVHWIWAKAPMTGDRTRQNGGHRDEIGLRRAWEDLQQSGRPGVTFQDIKRIAVAHRCLSGKWMIMKETGIHADLTWEKICRAMVTGRLGFSSKVSSAYALDNKDNTRHVICVYSEDFTDESGVMRLESGLRQLGIRCRLTYKPDAFTLLGVYRGNEWGLKPTIYTSDFDVGKNASVITSVYN